jgi:GTPase
VAEALIGIVVHQWQKAGAALLALSGGDLSGGDTIRIKGHTTDFTQTVRSMQINHEPVDSAGPGDEVAVAIDDRVRVKDSVYLVSADSTPGPWGFLKRLFGTRS